MKIDSTLAYLLYVASVTLGVQAAPIEKRAYTGGSTANDLNSGVCAPVTFIFARGSTETGNMGNSVGPALAKALIKSLGAGKVAVQGVEYPATIESNVSMGSEGGPAMAALAKKALQQCPGTKVVLSGYSQGATVAHYAVGKGGLSADDVSAAVLYGDPLYKSGKFGSVPASKVKEYCASGDGVCQTGTFAISAAHLSYAGSADIAGGAAFIAQNAAGGTASTSTTGTTDSGSTGTDSSASTGTDAASTTGSSSGLSSLLSGLKGGSGGLSSLGGGASSGGLSSLGGAASSSSGTDGDSTASTGTTGSSGLAGLLSGSGSSGLGGLSSLGSASSTGSSGLSGLSSLGSGSGNGGLASLLSGGGGV